MELGQIEKTRKRRFAYWCIGLVVALSIGFTIIDCLEGDTSEAVANIITGLILVVSFFGIKRYNADMLVYRTVLVLLSVVFFYHVASGSGTGTAIYWLFSFPLVFFFFLGKKEGILVCALFIVILAFILLNPLPLNFYDYSVMISLRFLSSLLLVTFIGYGLETSREKYGNLFIAKHLQLMEEKKQLEQAAIEIKSLSGLLPICSRCKKIRDDTGYWQQVEVYVRDHSEANFSHSICPDCIKIIYPEIRKSAEE